MKTHEWSPNTRSKILGLYQGKRHSLQDITHILNIPKTSVYNIKKRATAISKPRIGRPKKLTPRDMRRIIAHIRINRITRRLTLTQLIRALDLEVHENTLQRVLNEIGYKWRVARRRPFLNKRDRKRRLKFARKHLYWTIEDWSRVLFSDEIFIKLFMERNSGDRVWRKEDEVFHPDCIHYKKHSQGMRNIFWEVFRKGKMGSGVFFNLNRGQTVDSVIYRDQILLGPLKEFWMESFLDVNQPIVMEDNTPVHKDVCVQTRKDLGMITLEHPPNSPDLNPIEIIWEHMKDIIGKDYSEVSSMQEMRRIVHELWDGYSNDKWDSLIESMPERMRKVIKAKEGSIDN